MRISIRVKSALFLAVLLALALGALSYWVLAGVAEYQRDRYEDFLAQQARTTNVYIRQTYAMSSGMTAEQYIADRGKELAAQLGTLTGLPVTIYDMQGKLVGSSMPGSTVPDTRDILAYALDNRAVYQISGESLHYLSPISATGVQAGVVGFNYSLKEHYSFYNSIRALFIIIGMITFASSFLFGYLYFSRLTKRIGILRETVMRIKAGHYQETEPASYGDELGELGQGIFFMSERIRQSIKELEEEQENLRLAVEKLKLSDKRQKSFLGNVTHEFRTPLTIIQAYIDLLGMYPDDALLAEEARKSIKGETGRLNEMVEKVLELSAMEKYEFETKAEQVQLDELLKDIGGRMQGKAQKFGLELTMDLKEAAVWADRESLMQVFVNLLDNSIKYNRPGGKVFLNCRAEKGEAFVEVGDTGVGIPEEAVSRIFEPFFRADRDRSRSSGGSGLGLALVKELIERQKGSIALKYTGDKGTCFLIKLPLFGNIYINETS